MPTKCKGERSGSRQRERERERERERDFSHHEGLTPGKGGKRKQDGQSCRHADLTKPGWSGREIWNKYCPSVSSCTAPRWPHICTFISVTTCEMLKKGMTSGETTLD